MSEKLLLPSPSRAEVRDTVAAVLAESGLPWAWQGATGAPDRWVADTGPADLDVWCAASGPIAALARRHTCAVIAEAADPRRLRHTSVAVQTGGGLAVVDLTYGDLRVGPILLVPAAEVTADPVTHRLTGAAAVADLLVRPVLRGRIPAPERLAEAVAAWAAAGREARSGLARRLTGQLGAGVAADLLRAAGGARAAAGLPRRARWRLAARSLAPGVVGATWAQRRGVLPAGPAAGPLGLRVRGVVVALVGTDGAGKSTVAAALDESLRRSGFVTASAYFGMARGNLPGVAFARRVLGVGSTAPTPGTTGRGAGGPEADEPPADHVWLRRAAAWFYAGEYSWRYLRTVTPALARRRVVIADRWVFDLRESPWPGSRAARLVEFLVPAPDLLVLPDAPAEVIHRRKPERSLAGQRAQQDRFRRLLAERPARCAELLVDTTGSPGDAVAPLVAAVVQAAHTSRWRRGRR
ncbi:nucleoside/nucleotide kinase family protein [Actinoplanes awajinensis]|uniref:Thymidylate kinase n=1 Tax=Actinoplanes awajinensis subsp. mycoplanecinus TaxID=135947 RepID=A0A101JIU0_9ACTN|nr:thymidylate kinase [Actinoplanes awajinensis]KUL27695.1 thymidylate kinase [Actinoplanes awajinensis subsp. mycoplanecinus]